MADAICVPPFASRMTLTFWSQIALPITSYVANLSKFERCTQFSVFTLTVGTGETDGRVYVTRNAASSGTAA